VALRTRGTGVRIALGAERRDVMRMVMLEGMAIGYGALDEKIAFFFAPLLPIQWGGTYSSLHLLRREAQDCLIGTVLDEDEVIAQALREPHRLFATLMVVMA